jgi:hypothetical protein
MPQYAVSHKVQEVQANFMEETYIKKENIEDG